MELSQGQPSDVFNVLMVCTGNICRSPGAERLLALELSQRDLSDDLRIKIRSAGVRGWDAAPMDAPAASALERRGGVPTGFASRRLAESMLDDASLVLTATKDHRSDVVELNPRALRKTFTMKEFAQLITRDEKRYESARDLVAAAYQHRGGADIADYDVADPYGLTDDHHAVAMEEIHRCMSVIADRLATVTRA